MSESFDKGMEIRRRVLGDAYVDAAEANKSAFNEAFQALITEGAWGSVWARETISLRERSITSTKSRCISAPPPTPARAPTT